MRYDEASIEAGIDHLLLIAEQRNLLLESLKRALIKEDHESIIEYAKKIKGLN